MFLNDNVRQCLTIGYARLYVAHMNIIEIVEHCQYCRLIKTGKTFVFKTTYYSDRIAINIQYFVFIFIV